MSRGRARADEDKDLKGKDESDGGEEGGGPIALSLLSRRMASEGQGAQSRLQP